MNRELLKGMLCVAASLAGLAAAPAASANGAKSFIAEAAVIKGEVKLLGGLLLNPLTINVVDVGPIPSSGGFDADNLVEIKPGTLKALLLKGVVAEASAAGGFGTPAGLGRSHAFASVGRADVGLGPTLALLINADVIQSTASASCDQTTRRASTTGQSLIANLKLNGNPIPVTGQPNQTILLPGLAKVVINEQIGSKTTVPSPEGVPFVEDKAVLTVNAVHVTLLNPLDRLLATDLVVGYSKAGVGCLKYRP
jgi:hypothetical protein